MLAEGIVEREVLTKLDCPAEDNDVLVEDD